ncbi:HVO_A0114 family putative DNA-binding protein [Halorussus pelagicus]|uniref:HVO_A0114 family putative DNA-binding protein n=1 Tax=Halorussus pelagicus TaxID=2505977 RepID=UPI001FB73E5D|nr:MarR family transcriptional regulator [Halorussus pelagicus]
MTEPEIDPTTLTIRVESAESFFEDALDDLSGLESGDEVAETHVLSLPDEEALDRVLNPKNLALLRATLNDEPASVRELARAVERDVKNVSTAVNELAELGVLELEQDGRAKRPVVWYDEIEVRYSLRNPDLGGRTAGLS